MFRTMRVNWNENNKNKHSLLRLKNKFFLNLPLLFRLNLPCREEKQTATQINKSPINFNCQPN